MNGPRGVKRTAMKPTRSWLTLLLGLSISLSAEAGFEQFITVDGTRLKDGDTDFRFIAFNVPTLFYVEDEMAFAQTNPYRLPNEFELHDLFATVVEMGGNVVRAYTVPVRNRNFPPESVTYVEAPGVFNEEAFRAMDRALALASEYGVRVIVPLVNNWQWMGGRPEYAAFRGKDKDAFWTDRQLIEDFKKTIDFILNRTNTVTGVVYRDDPAILAWETGNELQNPPGWALEIGAYIKSIDTNHLLIDGFHAIHSEGHDVWLQDYSLASPLFDLINTHHYEPTSMETVRNLKKTVEMSGRRKPVFLGEFGFISTSGFEEVLDYVISEAAIPGALVWSLRRHHRAGGWYHHTEPVGYGLYRAYHWPGFDDGEKYDERAVLRLIRDKAFEIRGLKAPPVSVPGPPEIVPFDTAPLFSWRGSMGASGYDVERGDSADGPWTRLAWNVDDVETPGFALFSDTSAEVGRSYFYRVTARNASGVSEPSAPFGPVRIGHLTRVDRARNLGVLQHSKGVTVRSGDHRSYKEAFARLHGDAGAFVIYSAPGDLLELRVYAFERPGSEIAAPKLAFSSSADSVEWQAQSVVVQRFPSSETNYEYLVPVRYRLQAPPGARYLRADFGGESEIVRVELDYRP